MLGQQLEQIKIYQGNILSQQNHVFNKYSSTILFAKGPQDTTVHLTQSFWMVVAPPILVVNNN